MPDAKKPLTPEQWREDATLVREFLSEPALHQESSVVEPGRGVQEAMRRNALAAEVFGGDPYKYECRECEYSYSNPPKRCVESIFGKECGGEIIALFAGPEVKS